MHYMPLCLSIASVTPRYCTKKIWLKRYSTIYKFFFRLKSNNASSVKLNISQINTFSAYIFQGHSATNQPCTNSPSKILQHLSTSSPTYTNYHGLQFEKQIISTFRLESPYRLPDQYTQIFQSGLGPSKCVMPIHDIIA